jgi:CheY-like chemotaxis protein
MNKSRLKILLVEDDKIEVIKLKRSIPKDFDNYTFAFASNGKEAFSKIDEEIPDLIILDLNMPDTNGIEFLTIIKANEDLKHIPVIILTTSDNDKDISECYKLGIAGYVIKPLKYEDYELKIQAIINYWSHNEFLKL